MIALDSPLELTSEQQKNLAVAERINRETRANPDSPYVGQYIGVWKGEVVAVGATGGEVFRQLQALGDTAREGIVRQASADYETPISFWGVRAGKEA